MFFDDSTRYYLKRQRTKVDYDKVIDYGAVGETGENYYFFIYRDSFEKTTKYGAVVFLYTPFNLTKPIQITCTDTNIAWEHRHIYIEAAVHFLKKQCRDTMNVSGAVEQLYDDLKKKIADFTREEARKKEEFENFDFNILDQEIQAREVKLKKPERFFIDRHLRERLKAVKAPGKGGDEGKQTDSGRRPGALPGLSLVIPGQNGSRSALFKPVIVPVKKDGTYGAVKPAVRSQAVKYLLEKAPEPLEEFMGHLYDMNRKKQRDHTRVDIVSQVYFERLANLLLRMPDELTFFQLENEENRFYPLRKVRFTKMDLKIAPMLDREKLRFLPQLTIDGGGVMDAGLEYQVIAEGENKVYLFFVTADHQAYFAAPEDPRKYDRFFHFWAEVDEFSIHDLKAVLGALQAVTSGALVIHPDPLPLYTVKFHPTPILKIIGRDAFRKKPERIEVDFDYEPGVGRFLIDNPQIPHNQLVHYEKDNRFEALCLYLLKNDPLLKMELKRERWNEEVTGYYFTFTDGDDLNWLMENSSKYLEKGFKIYSTRRRQYIGYTGSKVRIDMTPGIDWLEFKPLLKNISTGETEEIKIERIDLANGTVTDKRGNLHLIQQEDVERLTRLSKYAERHGAVYRVPSENYFLINALYDQRMENMPGLQEKIEHARRFRDFKRIPAYKLSKHFKGKLRKYQTAGFRWLYFLREYRLSGCLADDMGLGKTVQTLALLQTLKDENQLNTSLLVLPVSAIPNWEAEIGKFTPGITFYRHLGTKRDKDFNGWKNHDLVITSYATLRNDIETFREFHFDYIVLDESQNIKNLSSQVSKAVKILNSNHRLALSGTPIENNTMELWSLFDFLMHGFLGTQQWFREQWAMPVEKYNDGEKAEILKKMLYPFILRRKKEDVETDLPEKVEVVESLQMEEEQVKLYIETAQYYSEEVDKAIAEGGLEKSSLKILEGMLRLRQICLFPQLANKEFAGVPSVKFGHFKGMLEDILAEGHKVLVFSQFVKVLTILRDHFDERKIDYCYIDGSVDAGTRGEMVKSFQEDQRIGVFLLSLKAGGVAINLTAADYVIIFDPWWNPAVEAQAIDRSHRIGQTRKVFVYRMVVKDTIEEKMLKLQDQKKELVEKLITSETKAFKNLTRDDIMGLFRFS